MIFSGRSLEDLSLDDFRLLVDNQVPEGPHLEYKQAAYSKSDRSEMLRDITAIANADGGYLILGIQEDGSGRAAGLTLIDDPLPIAQAMRQTCLDSIQERIEGLEIKAYEVGFNQGVIVVHIPPSDQRPHMVKLDRHTDFVRRYDTDKRPMTIGEIRELILGNPRFRRLAELELRAQSQRSDDLESAEREGSPYAQVITERTVERFLHRYLISASNTLSLVVVNPFISDLSGSVHSLRSIIDKINADRSRLYVITRPPRSDYQHAAMSLLHDCRHAEIRYNADIHAKLYVCWSRKESESFALFGSGNLTEGGLRNNIELGMMLYARGLGRKLVRELYQWGSQVLRTTSDLIKPINH
jgi:hypothetical protein